MSFFSMLLAILGSVLYSTVSSSTSDAKPKFTALVALPPDDDNINCFDLEAVEDSDDQEVSIIFSPLGNKVDSRVPLEASAVRNDSYTAINCMDSEKGVD